MVVLLCTVVSGHCIGNLPNKNYDPCIIRLCMAIVELYVCFCAPMQQKRTRNRYIRTFLLDEFLDSSLMCRFVVNFHIKVAFHL